MGLYKVFCTVDNKWEHFETDTPTETCPTDGAHAVVAGSLTAEVSELDGKKTTILEADPIYPVDGQVWYRSDINKFIFCEGGMARTFGVVQSETVIINNDVEVNSIDYIVLNSLDITPPSGTYVAFFASSAKCHNKDLLSTYAFFKDDAICINSEKKIFNVSRHIHTFDATLFTQDIITVNGSEEITLRIKTEGALVTVHNRSLILLKVG